MEKRAIAGIVLISVVASTMVTYFIQRGSRTPLDLLEENLPEEMPSGEAKIREISYSIVLRKNIESLILDLDCLSNATDKQGDPTSTVDQAVGICVKLCQDIGAPFAHESIEVGGAEGDLYDFSDAFSRLATKDATLAATTLYATIQIDQRKLAFRGVSDFFFNRNRSLASLTLSKNEEPETYLTMEASEAQSQNKPTIMEAPILGKKEYAPNKADDRFSVRLMVNSLGVPAHYGVMEVLRIYADADLQVSRGYLMPAAAA